MTRESCREAAFPFFVFKELSLSAGDWKDMFSAVQAGKFELVKHHIQNGVDPNYQHPEVLSTPLVAAIEAGHTEIALYLIENGADLNLRSEFDDLTPIEAAQKYGNQAVLEELGKRGVQGSWLSKLLRFLKR